MSQGIQKWVNLINIVETPTVEVVSILAFMVASDVLFTIFWSVRRWWQKPGSKWRFAIDRGGTFTDLVGVDPARQLPHGKAPLLLIVRIRRSVH